MEDEDQEKVDEEDIKRSSSFVLDNVFHQSKEEMREELEKFQKDVDEEFDDIEERILFKISFHTCNGGCKKAKMHSNL